MTEQELHNGKKLEKIEQEIIEICELMTVTVNQNGEPIMLIKTNEDSGKDARLIELIEEYKVLYFETTGSGIQILFTDDHEDLDDYELQLENLQTRIEDLIGPLEIVKEEDSRLVTVHVPIFPDDDKKEQILEMLSNFANLMVMIELKDVFLIIETE